jgi:hypothetical protein
VQIHIPREKSAALGSHSEKQWQEKLKLFDRCPNCKRDWSMIPRCPDRRYKYVWTKDHIVPLTKVELIKSITFSHYAINVTLEKDK